ncbi:MAG TPA: Rieske (2Fe-2S) protein [Thermomicrobiales bacterium]|jgi:3-phenylpropionate/trans-cinnamate dioxygenase ferredoxin subunit
MPKHVVATVDEIPPGARKIVEVEGRSIGVFNVDGAFFALRNRCPHQGGPLCRGTISAFVSATRPGEYRVSRHGQILRCPWHGWEFDISTGQSWFDPRKVRVRRYEVTVEADPGAVPGQLEKGPYVAETYPVSVERQYVLVELGNS